MTPPFDLLPILLPGLVVTLELTAGGIGLALLLSFLGGLGRLSQSRIIRIIASVYIEVFRGTSALIQLFWFYFVLPFFGIDLNAMSVGILVLGLNAGAYGSEVVRGAVQSVARGQYEAATALNMTRIQTLWRIIIPQSLVTMLPSMGNILIELLKATALVSLITISELTFVGQTIRADTLRTMEVFTIILLLYFGIALLLSKAVRMLEVRLKTRLIGGPI